MITTADYTSSTSGSGSGARVGVGSSGYIARTSTSGTVSDSEMGMMDSSAYLFSFIILGYKSLTISLDIKVTSPSVTAEFVYSA